MGDRPLKILHLMSCRGWSSDAYWAGRIVCELERVGQDVTLAFRLGVPKVETGLRDLGVNRLARLEMASGLAPGADVRDLIALRRLLPEFDLVHVHRGKEHWLATVANLLLPAPRPLVRTRHIMLPVKAHPPNRWLYARTDLVITVSEAYRQGYLATGLVAPDRLLALPGGVDSRRFTPDAKGLRFRQWLGVTAEDRVVGVVARLRPMKGHPTFLEAIARLARHYPGLRAVLIGEGPERDRLQQLTGRLGLGERVSFLGHVEPLPEAIAGLDVGVYASDASEGMGRVLFEYMSAGRPIVATQVGLAAEIFRNGESALLVPPRDPVALADGIRRLLHDRGHSATLGANARRLVEERYSGEVVATRLLERYRLLVSG